MSGRWGGMHEAGENPFLFVHKRTTSIPSPILPGIKRQIAADDGPDVGTSTTPIPLESAVRKRSVDASCIPQDRQPQSGQSIRADVVSPTRSRAYL